MASVEKWRRVWPLGPLVLRYFPSFFGLSVSGSDEPRRKAAFLVVPLGSPTSSHVEVLQLWPCERCMQIEFRDPFLEDMEPEQLLAVWDEARVASNSRVFAHGSAALPGADAARRRPRSGPTGGPADGPRSPLGESRRQSALAARLSLLTVSCGGSSLKKPRAAAGPADRVLALLQGAHSVLLALVSRIAITIHGCLARTRLLYTACIRL